MASKENDSFDGFKRKRQFWGLQKKTTVLRASKERYCSCWIEPIRLIFRQASWQNRFTCASYFCKLAVKNDTKVTRCIGKWDKHNQMPLKARRKANIAITVIKTGLIPFCTCSGVQYFRHHKCSTQLRTSMFMETFYLNFRRQAFHINVSLT